jgi:hypothetical protein
MSYNASTSKYRSTIKHMFLALVQERTLTQVFKKENGSVIKVEQTWTISFCLYFKSYQFSIGGYRALKNLLYCY